jgi:nucleotide-binding universal stress UspA family protein
MRKGLRILVAVDFSAASERALRAAATLAKKTGGTVTVAHVRSSSDLKAAIHENRGDLVRLAPRDLRRGLAAHYAKRLEAAKRRVAGARLLLLKGWPAGVVARTAQHGYDVVVVGSRGRGAVRLALLGSTTLEILHRSRVPVLVVQSPSRSKR